MFKTKTTTLFKKISFTFCCLFVLFATLIIFSKVSYGIPYFARKHDFQCNTCHVIPPKLNNFGETFRANGYRPPDNTPKNKTFPFALWITQRAEFNHSDNFEKTFPNRVEVISGGPIGKKASYFVEWRAVSLETRSDGDLRDRSGRFEDIFINYDLIESLTLKIGQYRLLNQVDDSLKLGLSTPFVIGASVPGDTSSNPRRTSIRSFSASGRSPSISLEHNTIKGKNSADGWFNIISLPFPGEISVPLTDEAQDEASFEFEFDPKGIFLESFYSWDLNSLGANLFFDLDDDRSAGSILGVYNKGPWFSTAGVGYGRKSGDTDYRLSFENEIVASKHISFGGRLDYRSDIDNETAFTPYINVLWPLTKWSLRLVIEQRIQSENHGTFAELSLIF